MAAAATSVLFKEDDRKRWNKHLDDLSLICQDIELAQDAGVPGMDELKSRCDLLRNKILLMKKTYFPGKP